MILLKGLVIFLILQFSGFNEIKPESTMRYAGIEVNFCQFPGARTYVNSSIAGIKQGVYPFTGIRKVLKKRKRKTTPGSLYKVPVNTFAVRPDVFDTCSTNLPAFDSQTFFNLPLHRGPPLFV